MTMMMILIHIVSSKPYLFFLLNSFVHVKWLYRRKCLLLHPFLLCWTWMKPLCIVVLIHFPKLNCDFRSFSMELNIRSEQSQNVCMASRYMWKRRKRRERNRVSICFPKLSCAFVSCIRGWNGLHDDQISVRSVCVGNIVLLRILVVPSVSSSPCVSFFLFRFLFGSVLILKNFSPVFRNCLKSLCSPLRRKCMQINYLIFWIHRNNISN